jgi:predicted anti-sigma-YlaC factor YlaD
MNCHDVESRLDDYVDGLLPESEATQVEQHLTECEECRDTVASLRALLEETANLPRDFAPERDLWPDILKETQTKPMARHRNAWRTMAIFAAAAALLLVAGVLLTRVPGNPHQVDLAGTSDGTAGLADEVRRADAEYAKARTELKAALAEEEAGLDPETRQVLDENLAIIDGAIEEIRKALEEEPDNPRLVHMLVATQQKGLEVIGLAAKLSDAT